MQQIHAVVLSYKRKDLLRRCLDAIAAQSRACDEIIVIDNASDDGTEQMLLQAQLPNLRVYVLSHNIGAAGGFSAGLRVAYQRGADLVWVMDDDVIPAEDALQQLLDAEQRLSALAEPWSFLLSTAYTASGLLTNVPRVDERGNCIDYENWPRLMEHGMVPVRPATFVSILVPRATLARHGLPLAAMFMWGVDTEYTLRISQQTPGYLVCASKVRHLRQVSGAISITRESDPTRIALHRHFVRNDLFVSRQFYRKRRLLGLIASRLLLTCRLLRCGQLRKAGIILRGLLESLAFAPQPEPADAPLEALGVSVRVLGVEEQPDSLAGRPAPKATDGQA